MCLFRQATDYSETKQVCRGGRDEKPILAFDGQQDAPAQEKRYYDVNQDGIEKLHCRNLAEFSSFASGVKYPRLRWRFGKAKAGDPGEDRSLRS
jgi:hypothetical protein